MLIFALHFYEVKMYKSKGCTCTFSLENVSKAKCKEWLPFDFCFTFLPCKNVQKQGNGIRKITLIVFYSKIERSLYQGK